MIDVYTEKLNSNDWILQNDLYFNLNTSNEEMSQKEVDLIRQIDGAKLTPDKHIETKYGLGTIRNFSYDLEFDDRITLVGGDSGVGKTVLYEMLEDIRLTDEYKAIRLFNYRSDDFQEAIKQCRDSFIVVDNADNLINDEVRKFINFELSNQYMLFLRNCDGLNVSDKSFKVMKFDNNKITLEEEL